MPCNSLAPYCCLAIDFIRMKCHSRWFSICMAWIVLILCGEAVGCTFMRVDIVADESTHNDGCSVLNANGSSCTLATRNDLGINGEPDNIKSSIILSSNPLLGHASSLNFLMAPYADPPRPLGKELFVNAVVKGHGFAPARRK